MKVFYDEGQPIQTFGIAGEFRLGEPRDIPDDLAEILIRKGRLKLFEADSESLFRLKGEKQNGTSTRR
jgi:hypothetical protein